MDEKSESAPIEREVRVVNKEGLHFRPIMQVVDLAVRFRGQIKIRCADREADARSPMELLMLVATHDSLLTLVAEGPDAQAALDALAKLVESGFGE